MTEKLLAEWFWTDRWMGSSAFLLPIAPRGLYREMLTQAWRRGARLPNDHEAVRRAVGCTLQEWKRHWPTIERYWRVDGDYLVNETQLEVYAEAMRVQQSASQRGAKGAAARWAKDSSGNAQASLEQWPPTPSPSPSPSPSDELLKDRSSSARGKVYDGARLKVSQKQHAVILNELGADAGYIDLIALYPKWDGQLVASREDFDVLVFIKRKAKDAVAAMRRGGALFSQPEDVDWSEECQRLHGGQCGGRYKHATQLLVDQERAKTERAAS